MADDRTTRRAVLAGAMAILAGCSSADGEGTSPAESGDTGPRNTDGEGPADTDGGPTGTESASPGGNPATGEVSQIGALTLTSPAFEDGGAIPERYGYTAQNVNPPLDVAGVPEDAGALALVVDDPDAVEPAGKVWDHWVVWNVSPDRREIPEGWDPTDAEQGTNDFGEVGYAGPNPPNGVHRYRFKCFALAEPLDLPVSTDVEGLGEAMAGHVLAQTQLSGTYPP